MLPSLPVLVTFASLQGRAGPQQQVAECRLRSIYGIPRASRQPRPTEAHQSRSYIRHGTRKKSPLSQPRAVRLSSCIVRLSATERPDTLAMPFANVPRHLMSRRSVVYRPPRSRGRAVRAELPRL